MKLIVGTIKMKFDYNFNHIFTSISKTEKAVCDLSIRSAF